MAFTPEPAHVGKGARAFATTRWSVVLQMRGAPSAGRAQALEDLCRAYWYPLYGFVRRQGVPVHDAEDLIQSFFTFLLEKAVFAQAERERGRFRTFLLAALKNFQANERARRVCLKRGGREVFVSFEELKAESRYEREPSSDLSPERLFDQKWAISLLDRVLARLRREYGAAGKATVFEELRALIWGGRGGMTYEEIGLKLGLTDGAIRIAVHRLRSRFKERLREEVADTVESPDAVDDELRHLLAALSP